MSSSLVSLFFWYLISQLCPWILLPEFAADSFSFLFVLCSFDGAFCTSLTCFSSPGSKVMMKSPRRILMKSSYGQKEFIDKDDSFVSAKSLFSIQNDYGSSSVLDTSHFEGENSDQDLLLDVPSNASFPQAELLPSSSFGALASTSSSSVYPNLVRPWWYLYTNLPSTYFVYDLRFDLLWLCCFCSIWGWMDTFFFSIFSHQTCYWDPKGDGWIYLPSVFVQTNKRLCYVAQTKGEKEEICVIPIVFSFFDKFRILLKIHV